MKALQNSEAGSPLDCALASAIDHSPHFAFNLAVAEQHEFEYEAALEDAEEAHYQSMLAREQGAKEERRDPAPARQLRRL